MSDKQQFINRIVAEGPLSMSDAHRLDEELSAQQSVGDAVAGLSDHEPSLTWRSALNERLIAMSSSPANRRATWIRWGGAAAVTASVALIVFVGIQQTSQPAADYSAELTTPEQMLVDVHRGASFALDTGVGDGTLPTSHSDSPVFKWTASDLEML